MIMGQDQNESGTKSNTAGHMVPAIIGAEIVEPKLRDMTIQPHSKIGKVAVIKI